MMPHSKTDLADNVLVCQIDFPTRIRNALYYAGLTTVGEVRESSDEMLMSLPDLGAKSVALLRQTLGLAPDRGARPIG
jgi:DNA-directed RNA polymerase alpha subunit